MMKKSPSVGTARVGSNASQHANGVKVEKKFEFFEKLKRFSRWKRTPAGNRTGHQLWPVLIILKLGGNIPLSVGEKGDQFVAPPVFSIPSLPSFTVASVFVYWWLTVLLHHGIHYQSSDDTSPFSLSTFLLRMNLILQPVLQISEILMGWFTSKKMAEYMNNWQTFETNFTSVFKDVYKYKLNVRRFRDFLLIFYVILPALYFVQHQECILTSELLGEGSHSVLSTLLTFCLVAFSFTEDVKTVLMYRVTQENFREMRNGIVAQHRVTTTSINKTPLGPEKVKQWIQLVNWIRNQHRLACRIQAPQQILGIGVSILLLSSNLFLFVRSLVGYANGKGEISLLPVGTCVVTLSRLLFKGVMADKVVEEEQSIAEELVLVEVSGANMFIKMELKFMYDLIVNKPTSTSFANVVTLSKGLTLQVLVHALRCLILLIQFNVFVAVESPVILSY